MLPDPGTTLQSSPPNIKHFKYGLVCHVTTYLFYDWLGLSVLLLEAERWVTPGEECRLQVHLVNPFHWFQDLELHTGFTSLDVKLILYRLLGFFLPHFYFCSFENMICKLAKGCSYALKKRINKSPISNFNHCHLIIHYYNFSDRTWRQQKIYFMCVLTTVPE